MQGQEVPRIETIEQFIDWAKQFIGARYLFRGVSKVSYNIEASAYRRLSSGARKTPDNLLEITKELINKTREQGHDEQNGRTLYDLELLAELQHLGAATCLIDFTYNSLVGLWFACQQSSKDPQEDGKVFAVYIDDLEQFPKVTHDFIQQKIDYFFRKDPQEGYSLYQWVSKLQNNRILAQRSVFIFGGSDIEADFECIISLENKQDILRDLDKMFGINEASIYPDFEGLARQHAENNRRLDPSPQDHFRRGIDARQRRNPDDAIRYYSAVIDSDTDDYLLTATAYYNRGNVHREQGNLDMAMADYDKALELNPDYVEAYSNRGVLLSFQGDYHGAIESFNRAVELDPTSIVLYLNRGATYSTIADFHNALVDYNKVEEIDPNHEGAYYNRGVLYGQLQDFDNAIANYSRAIELNPMDAPAYHNRAMIYVRRGNLDMAIADFNRAIECTAIGNLGHSLNQDCATMAIYLKGAIRWQNGEDSPRNLRLKLLLRH